MKLNLGCGTDYREDFVNIDGSDALPKIDCRIDFTDDTLVYYFRLGSIEFILANDVVEHLFHWEAIRLFKDMFLVLQPGGAIEIRVPDVEYILNSHYTVETKILLLYGGQETPQGTDAEMDKSRANWPQFFCHKYGWTRPSMESALRSVGFTDVRTESSGFNLIAYATKPK